MTELRTYPESALDSPRALAGTLGTFFTREYEGRGEFLTLVRAMAAAWERVVYVFEDAIACLDRHTVPILANASDRPWTIRQSAVTGKPLRYDSGSAYGDPGLVYGGTTPGRYVWQLDKPLVVNLIQTSPGDPAVVWCRGIDFDQPVDYSRIDFAFDPFATPNLSINPVFDQGAIIDTETTLWLSDCYEDRRHLADHVGYLIDVRCQSDARTRTIVNAILDCIYNGTTVDALERMLSAVVGVEACRTDGEVVEAVAYEIDNVAVVTDIASYLLPPTAIPIVAVGDVLRAGQQLCGALAGYSFNRGIVPPVDLLPCGRNLLDGVASDLGFPNQDVSITVSTVDGFTKVTWPLHGAAADVEKFWDIVHERGIIANRTLAHCLDVRTDPVGEPTAASLPATINPAEFLVGSLLRNCGMLYVFDLNQAADSHNLFWLEQLRRILPPEVALLFYAELPAIEDDGTIEDPEEELEWGPGLVPIEEYGLEVDADVAERLRLMA